MGLVRAYLTAQALTMWLSIRPDGPVVWVAWPWWPVWLWPLDSLC